MRHIYKYSCLILSLVLTASGISYAQTAKTKKLLMIGVDGVINTAIDYASTPGIDRLTSDASYSMNGFGGVPSYSSSGWSTLLTGVSADKHGVSVNKSYSGNRFTQYPSVVSRIKTAAPSLIVI